MNAAGRIPILLLLFAIPSPAGAPLFSALLGGSGQDYSTAVTSDAQGNTYVVGLTYSPDFAVTPGAAQSKFGGVCDAFVAKVAPDGTTVWSTYLGGILDDWATGVSLDRAGNVLVAGYTRSANFPLLNAVQNTLNGGASPSNFDGWAAKLDPSGSRLLYSTFLGGARDDGVDGIAADSAGNAYLAVTVHSAAGFPGTLSGPDQAGVMVAKLNPQGVPAYSFFHPFGTAAAIAIDANGSAYVAGSADSASPSGAAESFGASSSTQAMVFKVSPDGSKKIYETSLGGSVEASAQAIAVDNAGQVYLAGSTSSADFPLVRPLQGTLGARPLWKSTDAGVTWMPMDDLPFALPRALVVDPSAANTIYAATRDLGVFKSVDGGATWTKASSGIVGTNIDALAVDPVHPRTLYAATAPAAGASSPAAVYKTSNGASTWNLVDSPPSAISVLAVDAQNPDIVYEVSSTLRKSTDAGATWTDLALPGSIRSMAFDPRATGTLFAISNPMFCGFFCADNQPGFFYRSVDGGAHWIQSPPPAPTATTLLLDPSTNPTTVYDGLLARSVDGGITWMGANPPPQGDSNPSAAAIDPSGAFYAAVYANGMFRSLDSTQTWTAIGSPIPAFPPPGIGPSVVNIVPAGSTGAVFAIINQVASSGFVTKLSADGSRLLYSTYLRGHPTADPFVTFAAEPGVIGKQNWISSIAVDAAGNATVAGGTRAVDFAVAAPARAANAGGADAIVATISADGATLTESTYFGGSGDDGALAVGLDPEGNVILAGQTWSPDFPLPAGVNQPTGYGEAFLMKLARPGPPAITSVLNGASLQPGIEAGSWVAIRGVNLSNTYPGRIWRDEEVVNGALPASLDGVRVTINGKPAFVYYISPTQINVQAPSDPAVGSVNVIVDDNGVASAPAIASLQAVAPAFFLYPRTNYVITSRLADYALVSDPSAIPGTAPAKPGDTLVLWATGFGATEPAAPAGVAVSGAPAVRTPPEVTVGGIRVPVVSTVLTTGTVGLYQLTIQLPAATPAGRVSVQASVGGVPTQSGALLFVGTP